jgi:hypothetical protein
MTHQIPPRKELHTLVVGCGGNMSSNRDCSVRGGPFFFCGAF